MLSELINRLKQEDNWKYFLMTFEGMINEIVTEMREGQIKTPEQLIAANAKLELLHTMIDLDRYSDKWGGERA